MEHDIELYSSHCKDAVDRNNKEIQAYIRLLKDTCKGKEIPLQALTGPQSSRRLRLPNFKTIVGT